MSLLKSVAPKSGMEMIAKSLGIDLSSIQKTFESDLKKLAGFAESIDARLSRIEKHLSIGEDT